MDAFIEEQERKLFLKLVAEIDAEAVATGGPTFDEVQRSWQEWRSSRGPRESLGPNPGPPHEA